MNLKDMSADYKLDVLARNHALNRAEAYSIKRIEEIRAAVEENPPPTDVMTLSLAGSLARLDACSTSDLDLIIATKTEAFDESAIRAWRDKLCGELKIDTPNPKGVFDQPVTAESLYKYAGAAQEPYNVAALRMLLLLESEWIYNQDDHKSLVDGIVDGYAEDIAADPRKNFVYLLNDVSRFFRSLCVNYQHTKNDTDDGKWPIRNIKLRHSRVLIYFSLVASIGFLSNKREKSKIETLKDLVRLKPLRRLHAIYQLSGDSAFYKISGLYNNFIGVMSDESAREKLRGLGYEARYSSAEFSLLKTNSDALSSELLRFFEARRGNWDDRFFEYMVI